MRRLHLALLTAGLLLVSALPVAAQTYFPFGSVAVGVSSSGIRVGPFGCYVSTADPTYTTAQIHPCSLTTTGRIRVDISGTTQVEPGIDPIEVNATQVGTWSFNVANGSISVTEDGDISSGTTNVAQTASVEYRSNGSTRVVLFADPCQTEARLSFTISTTANVQVLTGTASERIFICDIVVVTATAQNINIVSGTGTVCATGITAVGGLGGGTTAATGWNFGANGGLVKGTGSNWIARVANLADNVCLLTSSTGQITGGGSYVSQP